MIEIYFFNLCKHFKDCSRNWRIFINCTGLFASLANTEKQTSCIKDRDKSWPSVCVCVCGVCERESRPASSYLNHVWPALLVTASNLPMGSGSKRNTHSFFFTHIHINIIQLATMSVLISLLSSAGPALSSTWEFVISSSLRFRLKAEWYMTVWNRKNPKAYPTNQTQIHVWIWKKWYKKAANKEKHWWWLLGNRKREVARLDEQCLQNVRVLVNIRDS